MKAEKTLIALERKFWQSMVDDDPETALELLSEPATLVTDHGAMAFDHATYRQMAAQGTMKLTGFEISDEKVEFPDERVAIVTYKVRQTMRKQGARADETQEMVDASTWLRDGDTWRCVLHTETPLAAMPAG